MAGFSLDSFAILGNNLYPEHVLDMLLHHYVTKAVEGNETRPSTGVEQPELARHYFKILYIRVFFGYCTSEGIVSKFVYSIFRRQASYAHRLQIFLCKL